MIIEIEVIEQIEDEPVGRSVNWVRDFMKSLGHHDPFVALGGMWRGGYLSFASPDGTPLPKWRCEQVLRDRVLGDGTRLLATDKGVKWDGRA